MCAAGNGTSAAEVSILQGLIQNASDPSQASAFQLGNQVASKCIIKTNLEFVASTGWTFHNDSGSYNQANGIDYLGRAREILASSLHDSSFFLSSLSSTAHILHGLPA